MAWIQQGVGNLPRRSVLPFGDRLQIRRLHVHANLPFLRVLKALYWSEIRWPRGVISGQQTNGGGLRGTELNDTRLSVRGLTCAKKHTPTIWTADRKQDGLMLSRCLHQSLTPTGWMSPRTLRLIWPGNLFPIFCCLILGGPCKWQHRFPVLGCQQWWRVLDTHSSAQHRDAPPTTTLGHHSARASLTRPGPFSPECLLLLCTIFHPLLMREAANRGGLLNASNY